MSLAGVSPGLLLLLLLLWLMFADASVAAAAWGLSLYKGFVCVEPLTAAP